ncbi:Protein NETO-1 [Aphelenchoides avenae]|nr:Protein NETO-1 [Aphelenchus avenae]
MGTSVGIRPTESTRPYNIRAAILPDADPCEQFHTGGMAGLHQFASPRYPNQYPANIDCVRVIHAPPGYSVRLKFRSRFQIEAAYEDSVISPESAASTSNCPNDYLVRRLAEITAANCILQDVRDGRYSFSPRVARLCGMRPPNFDIMSETGVMWLHFHSDNLLQYRGFFAEFEFVKKNSSDVLPPPDCHFSDAMPLDGYVDTSVAQRFYQIHRNSSSELDCVWQIQVPKWLQVAVFIEEFELAKQNQCQENVLEIYAGHIAEQPMRRYCGVTATHTYTGQSTVFVRVFFAGPLQVQNTRIRVLFSTYAAYKNCSEHELFSCGDDVCIPHSLACNGRANCLYRRDETHCMESTGESP